MRCKQPPSQTGNKCPILHDKQDQLYPIGFCYWEGSTSAADSDVDQICAEARGRPSSIRPADFCHLVELQAAEVLRGRRLTSNAGACAGRRTYGWTEIQSASAVGLTPGGKGVDSLKTHARWLSQQGVDR
jgi:hypothetical protein